MADDLPRLYPALPSLLAACAFRVRTALLWLANSIVPPQVPLFELATGGMAARAVRTAVELEIPRMLKDGPRTAEALATEAGVREDELHRILRVCAGVGVFKLRGGKWTHTMRSRALLRDALGTFRAPLLYFASNEIAQAWEGMEEALRTGRDGYYQRYGKTVWEWYEERPEERRRFARSMTALTAVDARGIAATSAFRGIQRLCDVGGGRGFLLDTILDRYPQMHGVLLDAPGVLEIAREDFARSGRSDRVELVEGSFFEAVPTGCDGILLKNILHDWNDDDCAKILSVCRAAVEPGTRLVVVEMLLEHDEVGGLAPRSDVHMMLATDRGRERSRAEITALLTAAGFGLNRVHHLAGDQRVLEAVAT